MKKELVKTTTINEGNAVKGFFMLAEIVSVIPMVVTFYLNRIDLACFSLIFMCYCAINTKRFGK